MHRVITNRLAGLGLVAITTLAAGGAVAVFAAGGPGENLIETGRAGSLIEMTQVNNSVLWTSLSGNVSLVSTLGWPSGDGTHDLGGALTLEVPNNPTAGTVNIGEKPMEMTFDFS